MIYAVVYAVVVLFFLCFGPRLKMPLMWDGRYFDEVDNAFASVLWPVFLLLNLAAWIVVFFSWMVDSVYALFEGH